MKSATKEIRNLFKNALSGLTFNGNPVPVYENLPVNTTGNYWIALQGITDNNNPNDSKFIRSVSIDVDILSRQFNYQDYEAVDTIAESVMNRIVPNVGGSLSGEEFQIGHIQLEAERYLDARSGEYYITRKILTFTQILIQL